MTEEEKLEKMLELKEIIDSGYAGVLPNGNIVDRRKRLLGKYATRYRKLG